MEWWIDGFEARRDKTRLEKALKTIKTLEKKVEQLESKIESLTQRAKTKGDDGE